MDAYLQFLRNKIKLASFDGYDIEASSLHSVLFPHQRDIVHSAQ